MSRQSKAAKKKIVAQQFTKLHLAGDKGPASTKPLHGKIHTEWKIRKNKLIAENEAKVAAEAAKQKAAKAKKEQAAADAAKKQAPKAQAKPAAKAAPTKATKAVPVTA